MDNYEDIINLPHHVSKRHPQMSMWNRAAQFAPFSALTGYEDAIQETQETALNAECKITNIYSNSDKMYE